MKPLKRYNVEALKRELLFRFHASTLQRFNEPK